MSVLIPTTIGGCIAVSDSDALETLSLAGLPPGTRVFNADVGHFFRLVTCVQRTFDLDAADTYAAGTFVFANGDFTAADEGNSLVLQLVPPNAELAGIYTIDNYVSPTEIDVLPATDFTQTLPMVGNLVVIENALETDVTVAALGTIESVWRLDTSDADVQSVTGDGIDNADPANPVFGIADAISDDPDGATAELDIATTSLKGLESATDKIAISGISAADWAGARAQELLVSVPALTRFKYIDLGRYTPSLTAPTFDAGLPGGGTSPLANATALFLNRSITQTPKTGSGGVVWRAQYGTPTGGDNADCGIINAASSHLIAIRRKANATDTHWGIQVAGAGAAFTPGTIVADNLWHNFMLTWNATNFRFYVDNAISATMSDLTDISDEAMFAYLINSATTLIKATDMIFGYIPV